MTHQFIFGFYHAVSILLFYPIADGSFAVYSCMHIGLYDAFGIDGTNIRIQIE